MTERFTLADVALSLQLLESDAVKCIEAYTVPLRIKAEDGSVKAIVGISVPPLAYACSLFLMGHGCRFLHYDEGGGANFTLAAELYGETQVYRVSQRYPVPEVLPRTLEKLIFMIYKDALDSPHQWGQGGEDAPQG